MSKRVDLTASLALLVIGAGACLEASRLGFGTVFAAKTVEGQLAGTLQYDWRPDGLVVAISIPRDRLS